MCSQSMMDYSGTRSQIFKNKFFETKNVLKYIRSNLLSYFILATLNIIESFDVRKNTHRVFIEYTFFFGGGGLQKNGPNTLRLT